MCKKYKYKECQECGKKLPLECFYKKSGRYNRYCKECYKAKQRYYYKNNEEYRKKRIKKAIEYYFKNKPNNNSEN